MKPEPIQASGYYDILTEEYAFTVCSGSLIISFDFLKKEDIEHLISCLSCMLPDDEPTANEQRQTNLGDSRCGGDDHAHGQGQRPSEPGQHGDGAQAAPLSD